VEARFRDAISRHQEGNLDEARGMYEGILRDRPGHADSLHMLGLLAHQEGRHGDARDLLAAAIESNDGVAFFHNNLGEVKRMLGETEGAAQCYQAAIALEPRYAQAHNNLGLVLFQLDQADRAVESFKTAIAIEAGEPGYHNNLGVVMEAMGRLEDAIPCFRASLELAPEQAEVNNNLGAALHTLGEFEEAERFLLAAAGIDATIANVPYNLSRLYVDQGRLDEAITAAGRAIELNPRYPEYHAALGAAQRAAGDMEASLNSLRTAVALDPAHAKSLNDLGVCLLVLGRFDEAESSFRRALDAEPRLAIAHENLARTRRFGEEDRTQIDFVEALAASSNQTDEDQVHLHFALGKMLDDIGEYERAFAHFRSANALEHKGMGFDAEAGRAFVERSRSAVDEALVEEKRAIGSASDMPIFIVGMLRSGTTLVEQILASHPLIHGGGELEHFRRVAAELPERLGGEAYPECLKSLDAQTVETVSNGYIDGLSSSLGDARHFTDKNPLNFEHLGLILLAFPKARVIHCRRDPMDLCLSIYFQHFAERHDFAYSFADIAEYHRQYVQLMEHWRGVFPDRILDVEYEGLVADLEGVGRGIFDFLKLEWDENCLEFHRTLRPVGTASHWQVRQPLYTRSVERWRHYEPHLEELRAALADQRAQ
jgi:tetratricopeptide (TPR) repeat protein